jgi:hypothetical protein
VKAYQSHFPGKRIIRHTSIYGLIRNKDVLRNERESRITEPLETLRWRGDRGTQAPQSVGYAFLRHVGIVEQRGTQRRVVGLVDADF